MYRNIELNYKINEAKTILTIEMTEETTNSFRSITREYDLIQLDEQSLVYNKALDDFQAEYDDTLANLLDRLIEKAIKGNE
jgi:hypothetical protein